MGSSQKEKILKLLKSIETGDLESLSAVNEDEYIQHNPQTHEGSEGLSALFKRLSKTSPRVNVVRVFEDGDFVFAHTEYDFSNRNVGFEIFRFEDGQAVEHWDNIQRRKGPNISGHTMVDGHTEVVDRDDTELNRMVVRSFVEEVIIGGQHKRLNEYISQGPYIEHGPSLSDDSTVFLNRLSASESSGSTMVKYSKCHRLLAEEDFVLSVCEGYVDKVET